MAAVRGRARAAVIGSCIPHVALAGFMFLAPPAAAAQEPDPEEPAVVDVLRQLRGALEGLRGAPTRRSERALTGTVTVTKHSDWGDSHNHCDIVATFTMLPFTAAHRDWGSEEVDATASVAAAGRYRNPGGTYTTFKIEGEGPVAAGAHVTVHDDGTYEIRFTSGAVEATETTNYPNQRPLVQPTRQCEYTVQFEGMPAPEADVFEGTRTDEHGATVRWSFRRRSD